MNIQNWKIFNKKGSYINWYHDSYVNLSFFTDLSNVKAAEAYCLTDPSGIIESVVVSDGGWNYNTANTQAILDYTFDADNKINLTSYEASIGFKDVSVYDPEGRNSSSISAVDVSYNASFIYPSVTYVGALFLEPVSVNLIETEHLTILEETSTGQYIRPYDPTSQLVFKMKDDDEEIKIFSVNEDTQTIEWLEEIVFDLNIQSNLPITLNIAFKAEDEGVFERVLGLYKRINGIDYLWGEFVIHAQSIGEDERFDTILQNLSPILRAKEIPKLFKEANINEAYPDWELVNYKSKHAALEFSQITPYIGTYKALINSIKWLGYEDIKIKEWFLNVKSGNKLSLYVPYEAEERKKTILYFSADERKNLKKLNELSLIYCINRDTGQIDEWGNPITENCYEYNLNEILTKLYALKIWLEKNIIGVHARIFDITGEGIYFERFRNIIYGTQDIGSRVYYKQSLTPITLQENSELITGESSINLTLREYEKTKISNFENFRFRDLIDYGYSQDPSYYDPCTGTYNTIPNDSSLLNNFDASLIRVGSTFRNPFYNLLDIQWRASVEKTESGVLTNQFVSNPLWIHENDIRWHNIFDEYSKFYDISTNLDILLEKAYFRDASNDNWVDSIAYSIYKSSSLNYVMESSMGIITEFPDYAFFSPSSSNPVLEYKVDANYMAPLLSFSNYKYTDSSGITSILDLGKTYFLDILDGKIAMDASLLTPDGSVYFTTQYINFNYDTSLVEQKITLNVVYNSPRMQLYQYDPSIYFYLQVPQYLDPQPSLIIDNSVYKMHVNHIGEYYLEVFGWDGQNVLYNNIYKENDGNYEVWTKYPTILAYIDSSAENNGFLFDGSWGILNNTDVSALYELNKEPIFDRVIPLQGLTLQKDVNGKYFINVPSITYFQDVPNPGDVAKFTNITERCVSIISPTQIEVDPDFQSFYQDDSINIVLYNKENYDLKDQSNNTIISVSGNTLDLAYALPTNFIIDQSTQIYLQNDSLRNVSNIANNLINKTVTLDVSSYIFLPTQLVGIIIYDTSTDYSWGSSFRVLDTSGYLHTLEGNIPQFAIDDQVRYKISAKHSFSTYASHQIDVNSAQEINNNFNIYLNDVYYHQYYLDNTFVFMNIIFDQEKILKQWYDPSDGLINNTFYPYDTAITVDVSTLVILRAVYDPSTYMLDQKNVWTISTHNDNKILMKVFNDSIFYIFDEIGTYNIQASAYDHYGNLKTRLFEGLITVK